MALDPAALVRAALAVTVEHWPGDLSDIRLRATYDERRRDVLVAAELWRSEDLLAVRFMLTAEALTWNDVLTLQATVRRSGHELESGR